MNQPTIFLTRPLKANSKIAHSLDELNLNYVLAPALAIENIPTLCPQPRADELFIFVSRNAVRSYFASLYKQNNLIKWPKSAWAAAVGKVTAAELSKYIPIEQIIAPENNTSSDSEALLELIKKFNIRPTIAHIFRAQSGRNWLANQLELSNWQTKFYPVYERKRIMWDKSTSLNFVSSKPAILLLTSSEAFKAIDSSLKSYNLQWPSSLYVVTLHSRITGCLQYSYENSANILDVTVTKPDDDALLNGLIDTFNKIRN